MKRLLGIFALVAASAPAAELTRVASSFEENDPFGMFLKFAFDHQREYAAISREWYQPSASDGVSRLQDVTELRYEKVQTSLNVDVHLGIFKDLELHVGVPIVFHQDREWYFARDTNRGNSTIYNNCTLDPRGTQCANPGQGEGQLFSSIQDFADPNRAQSFRGGLGDFTFGIAWNPFVQKKDPSKPTWNLRFDYTAPTAVMLNPSVATSTSSRGGIGDRVHKYTFSTHVSKRVNQYLEPYVGIWYTLPWLGPGYYSNCDDASAERMGYPENCKSNGGLWTRTMTGLQPQHKGGTNFGVEITFFEDEAKYQRIGVDLRGWFNYTSEGRVYNEMSDLFGKLLYTSDYGQIGGHFALTGSAAEFIDFRALVAFAYNTEHFLTNEYIGRDLVNDNGLVDVTLHPGEINPNYDYRVDRVGRRFRLEQQFVFRILVTASFNF